MKRDSLTMVLEPAKAEEYCQLRSAVGWGESNKTMVEASLSASLFHVCVRDGIRLVGMGRVIGDGFMYFYIQDVVVDPDYQKRGVGHMLMEQIEIYLKNAANKGSTIGLLAAKGKEAFYKRYGYVCRPDELLGAGMCKFV